MPDRPPVSAEDVPQSVVEIMGRAIDYRRVNGSYDPEADAAVALGAAESAGWRLIRDDDATVERMAAVLATESGEAPWMNLPTAYRDSYRQLARAALTAAQGGEDG